MTSPTTLGRFLEGGARIEAELAHGVEDAAVDRLQPVAHVGQRAVHDRRERVGEVALLERLAKVDRLDRARRNQLFSHEAGITGRSRSIQGRDRQCDVGADLLPRRGTRS